MRRELTLNLYLHKHIYDIITCFGSLDIIVNRMLDAVPVDTIATIDNPPPIDGNCKHYRVHIVNDAYIDAYKTGLKRDISLRRLVYWFIENEMYREFNWHLAKKATYIDTLISTLEAAMLSLQDETISDLIKQLIHKLKEYGDATQSHI